MSEVPSGFEDHSRSSSCASCSRLRESQKSSDEGFGSLNIYSSLPAPEGDDHACVGSRLCRFPCPTWPTADGMRFLLDPAPSLVFAGVDFRIAVQQNVLWSWCVMPSAFQSRGRLHGRVMLDSVCSLEFRQTNRPSSREAVGINFITPFSLLEGTGRRQCTLPRCPGSLLDLCSAGEPLEAGRTRLRSCRLCSTLWCACCAPWLLFLAVPGSRKHGGEPEQGVNALIHIQLLSINQGLVYVCHGLNVM